MPRRRDAGVNGSRRRGGAASLAHSQPGGAGLGGPAAHRSALTPEEAMAAHGRALSRLSNRACVSRRVGRALRLSTVVCDS